MPLLELSNSTVPKRIPPAPRTETRHVTEDECPGERPRKRPKGIRQFLLEPSQPLSKENLDRHTISVRSQVSYTAARYRFNNLNAANIFVRPGPPSEDIQPRINVVIHREVSNRRKREFSRIAEKLCNEFLIILNRPDWDPSLIPSAPTLFDWNFLEKPNVAASDSATSPNKRQQLDPPIQPGGSQPTMAPPPPPPPRVDQENLPIKTPRPDLSSITRPFMAQGVSEVKANRFLQVLQRRQILCSDPTQQAHSICFPPIAVEGKSYATGKTVFEAQNQASVYGTSMTCLQHELAKLTESASRGSYHSKAPMAFTICTEGPYFELWVHYTTSQEGVHMYNMNILKICHASLPEDVTEFLVMVDKVMSWASTDLVNDIVEQLVWLEEAERVQHTIPKTPLTTQ
ncbi:MAG: hypothetical protein Q9211_000902 [Gyalolechia sp. 1 TL-2023]